MHSKSLIYHGVQAYKNYLHLLANCIHFKTFILGERSTLQELPTSIGQLNALQKLDLGECLSLQELPTSIGQLNALQKLDLGGCSKLQ